MVRLLRASDVALCVKSPFLLWADAFVGEEHKDSLTVFQEALFEKGRVHEEEVLTQNYPGAQEVAYASVEDAFLQTKQFMQEGVDVLSQGVLLSEELGFEGRPDVLERVPGESVFGEYYYVVKEIKYAKNLKQHHILQAAFYNRLLGVIQGVTPKEFFLVNNEHEEFSFLYADYEALLDEMVVLARSVLCEDFVPLPVFGEDWPWTSYSQELARENNDLSLLYRLGRTVRDALNKQGIFTLQDFVAADKQTVLSIKGVGASSYKKWLLQAQAYLEDRVVVAKKPTLPASENVFFFDIEGDTEIGVDYLYGLLGEEGFVYFFADTPEDEEAMWRSFCLFMSNQPEDVVLYHYTSYEKTSVKRLYKKYGCDEGVYKKVVSSLTDVFPIVTSCVFLPIPAYSIKPLANYLGFSWRASDAGGANSIQWYQQYLLGDSSMKNKILLYNEDDVQATKVVTHWLQTLKR
ncbi:MAG: TM0106 family RecB-like putative nuclease [Candidatus Woesearchaeota archaeon]